MKKISKHEMKRVKGGYEPSPECPTDMRCSYIDPIALAPIIATCRSICPSLEDAETVSWTRGSYNGGNSCVCGYSDFACVPVE